MSNRFSFSTADHLIQLLTTANARLREKNQLLGRLAQQLAQAVRDDSYDPTVSGAAAALLSCEEVSKQIDLIAAGLGSYREKLYRLYIEDLIQEAEREHIDYAAAPRFGAAGEELVRKNRQLAFQNEVKLQMRDPGVPLAAKQVYASLGSKCPIAADDYAGIAHYHPGHGHIKFDLDGDLQGERGILATYFHEVGHMIDFQARGGGMLSDDLAFGSALQADCQAYIAAAQRRFGCSVTDAYWHIRQEMMSDVNLYAEVSDIMGSMTNSLCQTLWGHDVDYWNSDPRCFRWEAFANMYSASMGSPERRAVLRRFFPNAYQRFEELLEGAL